MWLHQSTSNERRAGRLRCEFLYPGSLYIGVCLLVDSDVEELLLSVAILPCSVLCLFSIPDCQRFPYHLCALSLIHCHEKVEFCPCLSVTALLYHRGVFLIVSECFAEEIGVTVSVSLGESDAEVKMTTEMLFSSTLIPLGDLHLSSPTYYFKSTMIAN